MVTNLEFVTPDHHDLDFLKSHFPTLGPHCISPQEAKCVYNCQFQSMGLSFLSRSLLQTLTDQDSAGNIPDPGRLVQGFATPEWIRKVRM